MLRVGDLVFVLVGAIDADGAVFLGTQVTHVVPAAGHEEEAELFAGERWPSLFLGPEQAERAAGCANGHQILDLRVGPTRYRLVGV